MAARAESSAIRKLITHWRYADSLGIDKSSSVYECVRFTWPKNRPSEIDVGPLDWGQVDFERRQIHLPKTKNGDPRTIPLNSIALTALKDLDGRGKKMRPTPVFPSIRTGESLQGSRGWFPRALEEAKIEGYTWHCNRHTFASRLVMAGVDLRTVAELLGHRTLQMVMRYSHLAPETRRRLSTDW